MNSLQKLLITGASGHLGKRVLEIVQNQYQGQVIATTRHPEKLKSLARANTELREADFNDVVSLEKAFEGADRLLLVSTDTLGSRVTQHKNAITAAKKAGIKHIIYTSYPNPEKAPAAVAPEHFQTEELIKASGISYTILRNNLYAENLLPSLANSLAQGTLIGMAGDGRTAYVSREDCAQAAAGALLSNSKENLIVDITGPEALTYNDIVKVAAEVTGKKLVYQDLSAADFKDALVKSGMPVMWADVYASFDLTAKQGLAGHVSDGVKKFSGKDAENLRSFLNRNISALIQ